MKLPKELEEKLNEICEFFARTTFEHMSSARDVESIENEARSSLSKRVEEITLYYVVSQLMKRIFPELFYEADIYAQQKFGRELDSLLAESAINDVSRKDDWYEKYRSVLFAKLDALEKLAERVLGSRPQRQS